MNRTVPLILAVALFMENMDSTVIATSLPAIAADIGTSPIALKLALTAYLVSLAIFIPISGWMADRFGAKRVFRFAIGVFVIGSVALRRLRLAAGVRACALPAGHGRGDDDAGRAAGAGARDGQARTRLGHGLAHHSGPDRPAGRAAGRRLHHHLFFSWHWIFLINVPIGAAGIWLAGRFLPEIAPAAAKPLDVIGFLLSAIAASGVVFGLSVVSLPALPPIVGVVTLAVGHRRRPALSRAMRGARQIRSSIFGLFAQPGLPRRDHRRLDLPHRQRRRRRSCCRCCSSSASA